MSIAADFVDMADSYMIEKLVKSTDESLGALWTAGNAVRMAETQTAFMKEPPTLLGLLGMTREPEVRTKSGFHACLRRHSRSSAQ